MSHTQTPIRIYEASITILGTYLAISSLFNSSLYQIISTALVQILRMFKITTISSQQITTIIPLLVTLFVSLLIVYDYIMGQPENIINIYRLAKPDTKTPDTRPSPKPTRRIHIRRNNPRRIPITILYISKPKNKP